MVKPKIVYRIWITINIVIILLFVYGIAGLNVSLKYDVDMSFDVKKERILKMLEESYNSEINLLIFLILFLALNVIVQKYLKNKNI